MRIAVTGSNGSVGKRVVLHFLKNGHQVTGIDLGTTATAFSESPGLDLDSNFEYKQADLTNYDRTLEALKGVNAVVHLAGIRNPMDYVVVAHNNNVVASYNVLRAAAEHKINRVVQASSVNIITLVYSQQPHFDYFPIDEDHPCLPDEPYGLSKLICETQAASIVRRYPSMRIASLRLHWSLPNRKEAQELKPEQAKNDLWGYVHEDSVADAFLLALTNENGKWSGHEAFFITAPEIAHDIDSAELKAQFWPDVPMKEGCVFEGRKGFFDCSKAERLLDWVHSGPNA